MKTLTQLREELVGQVIVFLKGAEDLEAYPEEGIRARVLGLDEDHDGEVIKMRVSYEEFDDTNRIHESSNYYDRDGNAVLTAREANDYSVTEQLYLNGEDRDWSSLFRLQGDFKQYMTEQIVGYYTPNAGYLVQYLGTVVVGIDCLSEGPTIVTDRTEFPVTAEELKMGITVHRLVPVL